MKNGDQVLQPGNSLSGLFKSYVDFPNESSTISDEDKENSLMNPNLWSIGGYQIMEDCAFQCKTSTQHNSEKAQVLQCRR